MSFASVKLDDMLIAREQRARRQRELLSKHGLPLVSLSLNIAGPVKRSHMGDFLFELTLKTLLRRLGKPEELIAARGITGCEAFLVYTIDADHLKDIAMELEAEGPAGRLLDIDVIAPDGSILSRGEKRACIVCGKPGMGCARSRAHSLAELQAKTTEMLREAVPGLIGGLAADSLSEEARLTPKPGLVDANNSGAHSDMDLPLMLKSAEALRGYFEDAARMGMEAGEELSDAEALRLRDRGLLAEKEMLAATGGVNTHKGAVYGLGLLCFGAGAKASRGIDPAAFASAAAALIPAPGDNTHGRTILEKYNAPGARGEAQGGFRTALAACGELGRGEDPLRVLLGIMARTDDTNVLWRGGAEGLDYVKRTAELLLDLKDSDMTAAAAEADREFISRRLSPGGCADILAQAMFLEKITPAE